MTITVDEIVDYWVDMVAKRTPHTRGEYGGRPYVCRLPPEAHVGQAVADPWRADPSCMKCVIRGAAAVRNGDSGGSISVKMNGVMHPVSDEVLLDAASRFMRVMLVG